MNESDFDWLTDRVEKMEFYASNVAFEKAVLADHAIQKMFVLAGDIEEGSDISLTLCSMLRGAFIAGYTKACEEIAKRPMTDNEESEMRESLADPLTEYI